MLIKSSIIVAAHTSPYRCESKKGLIPQSTTVVPRFESIIGDLLIEKKVVSTDRQVRLIFAVLLAESGLSSFAVNHIFGKSLAIGSTQCTYRNIVGLYGAEEAKEIFGDLVACHASLIQGGSVSPGVMLWMERDANLICRVFSELFKIPAKVTRQNILRYYTSYHDGTRMSEVDVNSRYTESLCSNVLKYYGGDYDIL